MIKTFKGNKAFIFAFFICFVYWAYLFFFSSMSIVYDAAGYEGLGQLIYKKGWIEFFRSGPNREPLYPLSIAMSMRLADILNISYQKIQTVFQISILFFMQILTLFSLKKFKINETIICIILLYIGFSPTILNSGLSLFSEIAAYPFILGIILVITKSWQEVLNESFKFKNVAILAFALAVLFIFITSVKGIFEFVAPLLLLPFMFLGIYGAFKKNNKILVKSLSLIIITFFTFFSFMHLYKSTNQKYNGRYAFTDRGDWMLYGTVDRRLSGKFTPKKLFSALAMIPGDGVCNAIYGRDTCYHWTFFKTEELGLKKLAELESHKVPQNEMGRELILLSIQRILKQPFEYALFHMIEWGRVFFWESTQIGFATYPPWLEKLYLFTPFQKGIRLVSGCLCVLSFFFLLFFVIKNRALLLQKGGSADIYQHYFFVLWLMVVFTQLYAFFCILIRYSFPMIPLYLLSAALFLNFLFINNRQRHDQ